MTEYNSSNKIFCKFCGAEINKNTRFCNNCGKNVKQKYSLIDKINNKINIFSVLIGLAVATIVLFIGAGSFGAAIFNKWDVSLYMFLVLFSMSFFGGIVTGITGSRNINEGLINGGILSLTTFIFFGIIIGIFLFVLMGITSSIASAFSSVGSPTASTVPTTSTSPNDMLFIVKGVVILITSFFAGLGGGALGAWIKGAIT